MSAAYIGPGPGIGPMELVIVVVLGLIIFAVPVAVVVLAIWIARRQYSQVDGPTRDDLLAEVDRLRERIAELEKRS